VITLRKLDENYINNLEEILGKDSEIKDKLKKVVDKKVNDIVLVGCVANYSQMLLIKYLFDGLSSKYRCNLYHGGEFERKIPKYINKNTIVIGMSHSGNTTEIHLSLKKVKEQKSAKTIAISNNKDSKISKISDVYFTYPNGENMSEMKLVLLYQLAIILNELKNEPLPEILKKELNNLPKKLYQAHNKYLKKAKIFAKNNKDRKLIYSMGCGPTMGAAFAFGNCKLMEMQWKDSGVLNASNFFHGPLEVTDDKRYFLLFNAQDKFSDHIKRVKEYLNFKNTNFHYIDTSEVYQYKNDISKEYISPILLWPAMTIYAWQLEEETSHNLDARRNMGKEGTEYIS